MKRTIAVLLAATVLLSFLAFWVPMEAAAESLYIRKIVSVVYDDSGSMDGDKWAYASYAMQAFCGMLNSEDQLFITYMSHSQSKTNYDPQQSDLSASGIQGSVDAIRNHRDSGSTPYESVGIAYNKLKSVNDSNPNTQYWLVVITDGAFDSYETKKDLNKDFENYTSQTMPNGSKPQVTFLSIGGSVISPDANEDKGIYTYHAKGAGDIIDVMSGMADRISGRTRLEKGDVKQIDANTVQVSSSIPLLNIAVLSQETDAVLTEAAYSNETPIPVSRSVSIGYPGYSSLVGGAFLVGDSQKVIGAGTYNIRFNKEVKAEDLVILFEPALEMRMTVTVNGTEVADHQQLQNVTEGDQVTVSCKIYEMGTDTEISPDLMPPNTRFALAISEDGKLTQESSGKEMSIEDYVLSNAQTQITAAVQIDGFNPIAYSTEFTPAKYVPKIVYTMEADFTGDTQSIKYDDITNNKDLGIAFTVLADGVPMTDPEAVKALDPQISVSPAGNDGTMTVEADGRILFTPNTASVTATSAGYFHVTVTCTIDDGTSADQTYSVLMAAYQVVPTDALNAVKKTEFFDNRTGVSFYITKDGVKLGKQDVEDLLEVELSEGYEALQVQTTVSEDGTILCVPYDPDEYVLTFGRWWTNWWRYFSLEGSDMVVTLHHSYGSAGARLPVTEASFKYQLLNVYAPLVLELLILAAIIAYIVRYITKPRFASNAALYVGSITRNIGNARTHRMELFEVHLNQYNKFKNLWNPFKELTVPVSGVSITAAKGNKIICNEPFPWYADSVRPQIRTVIINTPKDIVNYCQENDELTIHEIRASQVMDEQNNLISQDDSVYFFVRADTEYVGNGPRQMEVIDSAVAFCYSTIHE